MHITQFIARLEEIAKNYQTVYMWGSFGSLLTEGFIKQKAAQYPTWYTAAKQADLRRAIDGQTWAFDCVGLVKAVLWGWQGDKQRSYGGAVYAAHNVPDIDANAMLNACFGKSANFAQLKSGALLWVPGHVGIYLGNGRVVEATTAWSGGVQISNCENLRHIEGMKNRKWQKYGFLPYLDYEDNSLEDMNNNTENSNDNSMGDDAGGEGEIKYYNHLEEVPAWAKATVEKIIRKGILQGGDQNKLRLSEDMLRILVIQDRAGAY